MSRLPAIAADPVEPLCASGPGAVAEGTLAFYEKNAGPYCASTRLLSMASQLALFTEGVRPGSKVLDVGCGSGRDLAALKAAGFVPVGLDVSPRLARLAEEHSGCSVVVGDMREPPFPDRSFSGIWAAASLLHLRRHEAGPTLVRLRRLLTAGGSFCASGQSGSGEENTKDGRWFTYYAPAEWHDLLTQSGFTDIEIQLDEDTATSKGDEDRGWIQSFAHSA